MIAGNNGILNKAVTAKEKTEITSLKEEINMVINSRITEKAISGINENTFMKDIEKGISNARIEQIDGYTDVWYVFKNGAYITVYEDGEIIDGKAEIWDGVKKSCPEFKKDENNIWNWYIYKPSELKFLSDFVNNGNSLTGTVDLTEIVEKAGYNPENVSINYLSTKVYLMNNLDMGARETDANTIEEKWNTNSNKNVKWVPIGRDLTYSNPPGETDKAFTGLFEGNNHSIRGVYVDETETEYNGAGLFSGYTSCVKDLTLKNSFIKGRTIVGGIASLAGGNKFKNCKNINSAVIATTGSAGGIVGVSWKSLDGCICEGIVIGKSYVGGIVGQLNSSSMKVNNCKNTGSVEGDNHVGGIIGNIYNKKPEITSCINQGTIKSSNCVGGILGSSGENSTPTLTECENYGKIEGFGNSKYIGGIIGHIFSKAILNRCKNKGIISGKQEVGGIVGKYESDETELTECIDNGTVNITN